MIDKQESLTLKSMDFNKNHSYNKLHTEHGNKR